jgi:hypothetical protein
MSRPDLVEEDRLSLGRLEARLLAPHHLPSLAAGTGSATIATWCPSAIRESRSTGRAPSGAYDA